MFLIDAHVHIHDCFDLEIFFDSAYKNFRAAASRQGLKTDFAGVLLLAETSKCNWFHTLKSYSDENQSVGAWTFYRQKESSVLLVKRSESEKLFLIAGSQIVTSEKIEVLALISTSDFQDKRGILDTIKEIREDGALPVIPWGFGKWMGKRRRILEELLVKHSVPLFVGDNGGRPVFWSRPKLFSVVETLGGRVLPGSDPLPFPSEVRKVGRFGFGVQRAFDTEQLATLLKGILYDPTARLIPYGLLERPLNFVCIQSAVLVRKYFLSFGRCLCS